MLLPFDQVLLAMREERNFVARRSNWRRWIAFGSDPSTLVEHWPSGHQCEWRPTAADLVADDWILTWEDPK